MWDALVKRWCDLRGRDGFLKKKPGMNVMSFYTEIAQKQTVDSDYVKLLVIQELFK